MTTGIKIYLSFVIAAAISLIGLMFYLEPKMIVPSIIGVVIFTLILIVFYKTTSRKSEAEQKRIAIRNGRFAYVAIIVMIAVFFLAAAKYHHIPVIHFVRLWFGF